MISHEDRRRILETERRLLESGGILEPDNDQGDLSKDTRRHQGTRRHRRKLPEIPKHKKRKIDI